jgi:hypothetical protein
MCQVHVTHGVCSKFISEQDFNAAVRLAVIVFLVMQVPRFSAGSEENNKKSYSLRTLQLCGE